MQRLRLLGVRSAQCPLCNAAVFDSVIKWKAWGSHYYHNFSSWFAVHDDVAQASVTSELPFLPRITRDSRIEQVTSSDGAIRPNEPDMRLPSAVIPTRVDSSEVGGRDMLEGDAVLSTAAFPAGTSSAVYDVEPLVASLEDGIFDVTNFLVPQSLLPARQAALPQPTTIRKTKQGVRARLAALSSLRPEAQQQLTQPDRFLSGLYREGFVDTKILMGLLSQQNMDKLRRELSEHSWPERQLSDTQVEKLFQFITDHAADCQESMEFVQDFLNASSSHSLPSLTWIQQAFRALTEMDPAAAFEYLSELSQAFSGRFVKWPANRARFAMASQLLWQQLWENVGFYEAVKIFDLAVKHEIVSNDSAFHFIRQAVLSYSLRGSPYSELFTVWKQLGRRYGIEVPGLDVLLERAWQSGESQFIKAIGDLSKVSSRSISLESEALLAEVVISLIKLGHIKAARYLLARISVSPRHFISSLEILSQSADPAKATLIVEELASLASRSLLSGKGRGKMAVESKGKEGGDDEEKELAARIVSLVNPPRWKKKRWQPPRKAKPNQEQQHRLALCIYDTWELLASSIPDDIERSCSLENLKTWSAQHSVRSHKAHLNRSSR